MKKIILMILLSFSTLFAFEELNSSNFDEKINNKNVVIDFHAIY